MTVAPYCCSGLPWAARSSAPKSASNSRSGPEGSASETGRSHPVVSIGGIYAGSQAERTDAAAEHGPPASRTGVPSVGRTAIRRVPAPPPLIASTAIVPSIAGRIARRIPSHRPRPSAARLASSPRLVNGSLTPGPGPGKRFRCARPGLRPRRRRENTLTKSALTTLGKNRPGGKPPGAARRAIAFGPNTIALASSPVHRRIHQCSDTNREVQPGSEHWLVFVARFSQRPEAGIGPLACQGKQMRPV